MAQRMQIGPHKLLTAAEVERVAHFLHRRRNSKRKRKNQRWRVMISVFVLATYHGLRAKEIAGLKLRDFHNLSDDREKSRPYIFVPAEIVKGMNGIRHSREVRMTWQPPWVYSDIREHLDWRRELGAKEEDQFVCSVERRTLGKGITRIQVNRWFKEACKVLEREVHPHMGRHTFATMALNDWRIPINQVQAALGHRDLTTTTIYVHAVDDPSHDWRERKAG